MNRWSMRVVVGSVVLLAAAAALFLWRRDASQGRGRAGQRDGAPAFEMDDPRQAPAVRAPRGPQGPDDAGTATEPSPRMDTGRVNGTVRCQDGIPRDVCVIAHASDDAGPVQEAVTSHPGIDRTFSLTLRAQVWWHLQAEAPGWAAEPRVVRLEPEETVEVELELVPCGAIWGIVLSPEGAPVPGVTVAGWETGSPYRSLPSDDHGQYRITGPPGEYDLEAESGDWAPPYAIVRVEAGREVRQDLRFGRGLAIRGRIADKRGNPIPGAQIEARFQVPTAEVPGYLANRTGKSGSDGNYSIPKLHDGRHLLTCRVGGIAQEKVDVLAGADGVDFVIALPGRIEGKVVRKADGKPVKGADVTCTPFGSPGKGVPRPPSGEDGAFLFPSLASGVYVLTARADGFSTTTLQVSLAEEQVVSGLQIPLVEGGILRGRVVSAQAGAPIQGARVDIQDAGDATTDADGRFELAVAPGTWMVVVSHEGHANLRRSVEIRAGGTTEEEFPLTAGGAIFGRVLDAAGRPVVHATVLALDADSSCLSAAQTDNEGRYEIRDLPPGNCRVEWEPGGDGLQWTLRSPLVEVADGASVEVNFRLGVGARLRGVARRGGGPVGGVDVSVVGEAALCQTRTGDRGEFDIVGLPPGRYEVRIEHTTVMVNVPAEGVAREFDLPAGRMTGRVVDAETGAPPETALVIAYRVGVPPGEQPVESPWYCSTGPSGEFRLDGVDDGEYYVRVSARDHGTRILGPFAVREGRTVECGDVQLGCGATIVGIVADARGNPVPGAAFSLRAAESDVPLGYPNFSSGMASDAEGRFRIGHLSPGRYRGEVVAGARRVSFEAGVAEGGTIEVRVTLGD